ncbi:MAG: hypothetical protein CSA81_10665 [Acidobacteria bacterium]|nr:MAG: hypothetical protein CSA81_10665 [Acidobacteriota bacterium]
MERQDILNKDNLSGEKLQNASLGFCDLRGKNFRGADLSHAHLGYSDLRGADLRNANLFGANLGEADLRGADLRYCDFRHTNLEGAKLSGADIRECSHGILLPNNSSSTRSLQDLLSPVWTETREFKEAREEGYHPVSYWGEQYNVEGSGTLYRDKKRWAYIKKKLGVLVFGDKETFKEVRLVQRYQNYAQWAYMVTQKGFERMARQLGYKISEKH